MFEEMFFALVMISCFCGCSFFFLRALVKPRPVLNFTSYSRAALRLQRNYAIFAWGIMTLAFLAGVVMSFYQVFILI